MKKSQSFEEVLAHREAVQGHIKSIERQLGHAPNLASLSISFGEERTRLNAYLERFGGERSMGHNEKQTLALYRQRFESAQKQYDQAKSAQDALRIKLDTLQAELAALDCSCSLQELLGIQDEMGTAAKEVATIRQAIADQEGKVAAAREAVPSIQATIEKRQGLLAQKEIGQDVEADLAAIELELEGRKQLVLEARTQAETIAAQAEEIVAGLKRLLHDKEERVKRLQEQIQPQAVKSFLLVRAEALGTEYVKAADALIAKFTQLAALGSILASRDESDHNVVPWKNTLRLRLPVFPTVSCQGLSGEPVQWHDSAAIEAERQVLQGLGVLSL